MSLSLTPIASHTATDAATDLACLLQGVFSSCNWMYLQADLQVHCIDALATVARLSGLGSRCATKSRNLTLTQLAFELQPPQLFS